jgi:hypothetical protein
MSGGNDLPHGQGLVPPPRRPSPLRRRSAAVVERSSPETAAEPHSPLGQVFDSKAILRRLRLEIRRQNDPMASVNLSDARDPRKFPRFPIRRTPSGLMTDRHPITVRSTHYKPTDRLRGRR